MSQYIIPLQQIPNQTITVDLDGQQCRFDILTRGLSVFMNLTVDDEVLINGVVCQTNNNLIKYNHLGFNGKLYFVDTQGDLDPLYYGFNDRWLLIYEDESV